MSTQPRTVLLLIDIQDGFLDSAHWGPSRSNPAFEQNANYLIESYRSLTSNSKSHKLVHVQHSSLEDQWPTSPLRPDQPGFKIQAFAAPKDGEMVIVKHVNSAFIGTNLEDVLKEHFGGSPGKLFIAGLTTDHCVSTTTRMAGNLGVCGKGGEVVLVGDATAAWAKGVGSSSTGGDFADAETVHRVHLQSLSGEFANVERTEDVLRRWESWI